MQRVPRVAFTIALGALASLLLLLALVSVGGVLVGGADASGARYAAAAGIFLGAAALFAAAAFFTSEPAIGPRPWLVLAIVAVIASFVPYAFVFGPIGLVLNAALTALAAGSLYANLKGERRLAAREEADEASE